MIDTNESQLSAEFTHETLVRLYDAVNAYEPDAQPGFYLRLAQDLKARRIIDLGCGSGLITCDLAAHGFEMIGIDPSPKMIKLAKERDSQRLVQWIVGGADSVGTYDADLAIMTGHVAQFFLTDDAWQSALASLHAGLRAGGALAFETRNLEAKEWTSWTRSDPQVVHDPRLGAIQTWSEYESFENSVLSYSMHYLIESSGERLSSPTRLRFRSQAEVERSLEQAGFRAVDIFGSWDRGPVSASRPELIVHARQA